MGAVDICSPWAAKNFVLRVWVIPTLGQHLSMTTFLSQLSFLVIGVTSAAPCTSPSAIHKIAAANTQGDLRATMGVFPLGNFPTDIPFLVLHFALGGVPR